MKRSILYGIVGLLMFTLLAPSFVQAIASVSSVSVNDITPHGARIAWRTSSSATAKILFGTSMSYGQTTPVFGNGTQFHWPIGGLKPSTTYNFCIQTTDSSGGVSPCGSSATNFTFTTPAGSSVAELPQAPVPVDTTMPSFNGTTHRVNADCSNFQTLINLAQGGDKIVLPKGTVCTGQYIFPVKSGSSWIHVTTDGTLPSPGTRITPAYEAEMAVIRTNRPFINTRLYSNAGSISGQCNQLAGHYGNLYGKQPTAYVDEFEFGGCKFDGTAAPYPYTSGTTVPSSCTEGTWFKKTDAPLANKMHICTRDAGQLKYLPVYSNAQGEWASSAAIRLAPGAHHYRFSGIKVTSIPSPASFDGGFYPGFNFATLIEQGDTNNHHIVFDRVIVKLDEPSETSHAVAWEGSHVAIIDSWMEGILDRSKFITQGGASAIWTAAGPGPGKIHNNYISAPGISIFLTSDSVAITTPMTDYTISNNYIYKNVEKYRFGGSEHNGETYYLNRHAIELKVGRRIKISGNVIDGNWGQAQQGALIMLSPRPSPSSSLYPDNNLGISDVDISNNILKNAPIMIYTSGHNDFNLQPTVTTRISIQNNLVQGASGRLYDNGGYCSPLSSSCSGYFLWNFLGGEDLIVSHNTLDTIDGAFFSMVSDGLGQYGSNLRFTDNVLSMKNNSTYDANGITISSDWGESALNKIWKNDTGPGWQFAGNVIYGNSQPLHPFYNTPYPAGNVWLANKSAMNFGSDFSIGSNSAAKNKATDGSDPGINATVLAAATAHTISGGASTYVPPPPPPPPPVVVVNPPSISTVAVSGITQSSATITWSTNVSSDSVVEYGGTTSYGNTSVGNSGATLHTVSLTSLNPGTTYQYQVKSKDSSGNTGVSGNYSFTTSPLATPTVVPASSCGQVATNAFTACYYNGKNFDTLVNTTSVPTINYYWGLGSPSTAVNVNQFSAKYSGSFTFAAGTHTFTVSSDDGVRLYIDGVIIIDKWIDQGLTTYTASKALTAGSHTVSLEYYENTLDAAVSLSWVMTAAAPVPTVVISTPEVTSITSTGATITWQASALSNSQIEFGLTTAYGNMTELSSPPTTSHSAVITRLLPNTLYHYRVRSINSINSLETSSDYTFLTQAFTDVSTTNSSNTSSVSVSNTYTAAPTTVDTTTTQPNTTTPPVVLQTPQTPLVVPTPTGQATIIINQTLKRGMNHAEVQLVQDYLKKNGFFDNTITTTTYFGPATEAAVKRYQAANGIESTGLIGPLTRARLSGGSIPVSTVAPVIPQGFPITVYSGMQHPDVVRLQDILKRLGFMSRTVPSTGYFGPMTKSAVRSFQRTYDIASYGSEATTGYGMAGKKTWTKLLSL